MLLLLLLLTDCIRDLQDYFSYSPSRLYKDLHNDFDLVDAMETGGYTSVKFERNLTAGDEYADVQFTVRLYNKYSRNACGQTLISTEGARVYRDIWGKPFSETPFHGLYKAVRYYKKSRSDGQK